jgi:hypothetical protein
MWRLVDQVEECFPIRNVENKGLVTNLQFPLVPDLSPHIESLYSKPGIWKD